MRIKHIASSSSGNAHVFGDLLLDCGVNIDRLREEVDLKSLSGCLLSHEHGDHSKAVGDILRSGVPVYTSRGSAEALGIYNHHRVYTPEEIELFYVGDWRVKSFPVKHDSEEPRAFQFQSEPVKAVYITDASFSKYYFRGLTHMFIECNYSKEIIGENVERGAINYARKRRTIDNHFSLEDVEDLIRASGTERLRSIHLLHLSDANSDEKLFKERLEGEFGVPTIIAPK